MIASHFVLADMLATLEAGDIDLAERTFAKFRKRYHKDRQLQDICESFSQYLLGKKDDEMVELKRMLSGLKASRKFECSGGASLPYKNRRNPSFKDITLHYEEYDR